MIAAAAVVCLVAAVGLAIALVRTRARLARLEVALRTTIGERDALELRAVEADADARRAEEARDDATARVQRARRDAADIAARLREEADARTEAEAALSTLRSRWDDAQRDLDAARAAIDERDAELGQLRAAVSAAPDSGGIDAEVLWALALERAERTWQTSISLGIEEASPVVTSPNPLRAAIEIEIDAAREEAGADIELHWSGDGAVSAATAVTAFSLVESTIASVAKAASTTTLDVQVTDDAVEVRFAATDADGRPIAVDVPGADPACPGVVVVPVA